MCLQLGMWYSWLQSHSHSVVQLLNLAHSSDPQIRQLGINALSEQTKWTGKHYISKERQDCVMNIFNGLYQCYILFSHDVDF